MRWRSNGAPRRSRTTRRAGPKSSCGSRSMRKTRVKEQAAAALLFAALGDETRLALLQRLSDEGPASISALAERFSMTRQGVTKHLQELADAGVIDGVREGREHVWALNPS